MNFSAVDKALIEGVVPYGSAAETALKSKNFVTPGAVLLVGRGGEVLYHKAFGCRSLLPEVTPMQKDAVFDVASLTKALVTTTLVMHAVEVGILKLDRRLSQIIQAYGTLGKDRITVRHLLNHSSGYADWAPYYRLVANADQGERMGIMGTRSAVEMVYQEIYRAPLENLPGKVAKYSDLGFILLGNILEVIHGGPEATLDKLSQRYIFEPLKLKSTGYIDLTKMKRRGIEAVTDVIVPTAKCPWRRRILCGEVHDDNAWVMGGVAGHAGIFSTAEDLHRFASEMIGCFKGSGHLICKDVVEEFWKKDESVSGSTWALGWDTPSPTESSAGKHFSKGSVGHLGFTGCSMWIDPVREIDVILLTNRVHPDPENKLIKEYRPKVHDAVMEAIL